MRSLGFATRVRWLFFAAWLACFPLGTHRPCCLAEAVACFLQRSPLANSSALQVGLFHHTRTAPPTISITNRLNASLRHSPVTQREPFRDAFVRTPRQTPFLLQRRTTGCMPGTTQSPTNGPNDGPTTTTTRAQTPPVPPDDERQHPSGEWLSSTLQPAVGAAAASCRLSVLVFDSRFLPFSHLGNISRSAASSPSSGTRAPFLHASSVPLSVSGVFGESNTWNMILDLSCHHSVGSLREFWSWNEQPDREPANSR